MFTTIVEGIINILLMSKLFLKINKQLVHNHIVRMWQDWKSHSVYLPPNPLFFLLQHIFDP